MDQWVERGDVSRTRMFGGYRPLSVLGHGGGAIVYRASSLHVPRRQCAVKVAYDDKGMQQILTERSALQVLEGVTGVVQALGCGTGDGVLYLALALIEGQTMERYLASARGRLGYALRSLAHVADTVARVHARGVIHRDLKPENVVMPWEASSQGAVPRPTVIDFGLARRSGGGCPDQVSGTLAYMSPEAFDLTVEPSPAQDLYALGIMLYRICTGRLPFRGRTPQETLSRHHLDPIPVLSPIYPQGLNGLLGLCLKKRPSSRLDDAQTFARTLREAIAELGFLEQTSLPRARTGMSSTRLANTLVDLHSASE